MEGAAWVVDGCISGRPRTECVSARVCWIWTRSTMKMASSDAADCVGAESDLDER